MLLKNLFRHWTYQVFSPGTVLQEKYEAFKALLAHDKAAHEVMAELEDIYYNQERVDFSQITQKVGQLSEDVRGIVENLVRMCPLRYQDLPGYYKKIDAYIRFMLVPPAAGVSPPYTLGMSDILKHGPAMAGGKAFNLATLSDRLDLPVPAGFAISTQATHLFLATNRLRPRINAVLAGLDIQSAASLEKASREIIGWIMAAAIPPEIEAAVDAARRACTWQQPDDLRLAVRSSAVAEDGRSSFAGQYHTELNVSAAGILRAYQKVIASKYAPRALYYRINHGLSDEETPMAALVLEMIDARASGVMYTRRPDDPDADHLDIHAVWGLGERLVGGETAADIFRLSRSDPPEIETRQISEKTDQMIHSPAGGTRVVPVSEEKRQVPCLGTRGVLALAAWGLRIEACYGTPQDVEWCRDGNGHFFVLQSRPLNIESVEPDRLECRFDDVEKAVLLSGGEKAAGGIGAGRVFTLSQDSDLDGLPAGSILVAKNSRPHYVRILDRVAAVVTDTGSAAGHFASVAREFGIPMLVNTRSATSLLQPGQEVTVHADDKTIYAGIIPAMIDSPCARRNLLVDSHFMRKMEYIMGFISPLGMTDPEADDFTAGGCRSLHDIIRFAHEKAVAEMFSQGDRRITRKQGARKLATDIPMQVYLLDVGNGLTEKPADPRAVRIEEVRCLPFTAVWKGLSHPDIQWSEFGHFDWAEYDKIIMNGGIISADSALFSSYAVLSDHYLNLALKFGYHFVILDTICGEHVEENYVLFRFTGGGADYAGRSLRADFLRQILDRIGFSVEDRKGDLINARTAHDDRAAMEEKLDWIGRLLGATRLMDMYLKDASQIDGFVSDFMAGRYHFAKADAVDTSGSVIA